MPSVESKNSAPYSNFCCFSALSQSSDSINAPPEPVSASNLRKRA